MAIKALTFDLDDTLWDVRPVLEQAETAMHAWLAQHYPPMAHRYDIEAFLQLRLDLMHERPELAHDVTGLRKAALRDAALASGCSLEAVEPAFEVFLEARNSVEFYEDVLPVLERLAEHYPMAALTNGNADIGRIGLSHVFEFSLSAIDVGRPKPDTAMYHAACERLGVAAQDIAHIGDDLGRDVAGADSAGMRTVWLNRAGSEPTGEISPHAEIRSLYELEPVLTRWRGAQPERF